MPRVFVSFLTACSIELEEDVRNDQSPICLLALVEVAMQAAGRGARAVPLGAGERSSAQELGVTWAGRSGRARQAIGNSRGRFGIVRTKAMLRRLLGCAGHEIMSGEGGLFRTYSRRGNEAVSAYHHVDVFKLTNSFSADSSCHPDLVLPLTLFPWTWHYNCTDFGRHSLSPTGDSSRLSSRRVRPLPGYFCFSPRFDSCHLYAKLVATI